jgi:hypothetical protein
MGRTSTGYLENEVMKYLLAVLIQNTAKINSDSRPGERNSEKNAGGKNVSFNKEDYKDIQENFGFVI